MKHDELAENLARHLMGRQNPPMVWTDMQLGPVGSPRPDVYVIEKTDTAFRPVAYEIKVSVSDFRADVTAGKWQTYRPMANGIWFAFPDTLKIGRDDVPKECGIIRYNEGANKWTALRKPVLRPVDNLPIKVWQKLLIDGVERAHGPAWRQRVHNEYLATEHARKRWGAEVADVLRDTAAAKRRLENIRSGVDYEIKASRERAEAANAMLDQRGKEELARVRTTLAIAMSCALRRAVSTLKHTWFGSGLAARE